MNTYGKGRGIRCFAFYRRVGGYLLGPVIPPPVPDFGAETHRLFRGKLAEIVKLVEVGDVAALKAVENKRCSSSMQAMV
jgi:hypothetical protein